MEDTLLDEDIKTAKYQGSEKYEHLYDDAWRSENFDGITLCEVPVNYLDDKNPEIGGGHTDNLISSAITEVSLDFLSGSRVAHALPFVDDSDDSHNSDPPFKTTAAGRGYYARYPETAAGLSDNDWNPYGTESDSNTTPRFAILDGTKKQESGLSQLSFNPPLSSTEFSKSNTPQYLAQDMSDILECPEGGTLQTLKFCDSLDSSQASVNIEAKKKIDQLLINNAVADLNKTFRQEEIKNSSFLSDSNPCLKLDLNDSAETVKSRLYIYESASTIKSKGQNNIDLVKRDLQEIEEGLQRNQRLDSSYFPTRKQQNSAGDKNISTSSDSDIIPSTSSTPEKAALNAAWPTVPSTIYDSRGRSMKKPLNGYYSDGDEAHSSGSSERLEEHISSDLQFLPKPREDISHPDDSNVLLTDIGNQKSLVRSSYSELNSQGLAEKVLRILSKDDPDRQVAGILSDVGVKERTLNTRSLQNMSSFSRDLDDGGLFELANIRRKLDLSELSSSRVSNTEHGSKGFGAVEDFSEYLKKQLALTAEAPFFKSPDLRVPSQIITCYPVTADVSQTDVPSNDTKQDRDTRNLAGSTLQKDESLSQIMSEKEKPTQGVKLLQSSEGSVDAYKASVSTKQVTSPLSSDSETSSGRSKVKYRPYKPPGSQHVYYTESDAADSVTTQESSHIGSDDARGPTFPKSALGSRTDPPTSIGIYSWPKSNENVSPTETLSAIPEKSISDEPGSESGRFTDLGASYSYKTSSSNSIDKQPGSTREAAQNKKMTDSSYPNAGGPKSSRDITESPKTQKSLTIQPKNQSTETGSKGQDTAKYVTGKSLQLGKETAKYDTGQSLQCGKDDGSSLILNRPDRNLNDNVNQSRMHFSKDLGQHGGNNYRGNFFSDIRSDFSRSDPVISTAFHGALSPDIIESIGRRSPYLGSSIERSLAQPPATKRQPYSQSTQGLGKSNPPTFLARERPGRDNESLPYLAKGVKEGQGAPKQAWVETEKSSSNKENQPIPNILVGSATDARDAGSNSNPSTSAASSSHSQEIASQQIVRMMLARSNFPNRNAEITLDGMSTDSQDTEQDLEPVSQRAKLLTQALTQAREPDGTTQDVNRLWEQFLAANQSLESSLDSARKEDVAELLRNPSQHMITHYMKARQEYKIQRLERSEAERERKQKEQESFGNGKKNINGNKKGNSSSGTKFRDRDSNFENLFSILEDSNFEMSPTKPGSAAKQKVARQQHMIDPNMAKLRERIRSQRRKAERDAMKEQQQKEKLKKLQHLLLAKRRGEISNQTFDRHLDEISLTASSTDKSSDSIISMSSDSSKKIWRTVDSKNTTPLSNESTTAKDSSTDMLAWKAEKLKRLRLTDKAKRTKSKPKSNELAKEGHINQRTLFQLVGAGYLTPEEAYKLSLKKSQDDQQDDAMDSSLNSSLDRSKPHNLYSPYCRDNHQMYQKHPVPKLKLSPHLDNPWPLRLKHFAKTTESGKTKDTAMYNQNYFSGHGSGAEGSDLDSSRSVLSDDVSSIHFEAQPTRNFLPSALKPSRRQASPASKKGNGPLRLRKGAEQWQTDENGLSKFPKKKGIAWEIPLTRPPPQHSAVEPGCNPKLKIHALRDQLPVVKPLRERPAVSNVDPMLTSLRQHLTSSINIFNPADHPDGIPRKLWKQVVEQDPLASKINHWDVDPLQDKVEYILDRHCLELDGDEMKPGKEGTLQEFFLAKKQDFISRCRERQKRITLARENRHLQECLRLEREAIFGEQDRATPSNLFAHPFSDNLYQPKRRVLTKDEMKNLTSQRYKKLPEVLQKQASSKRDQEMKTNRLRLKVFSKKVQKDARRKYCGKLRC